MESLTHQDPSRWNEVIIPAVKDFLNKDYGPLTELLNAVPVPLEESFLVAFLDYINANCSEDDARVALRRMAHNAKFRRFVQKMPNYRSQGIFLANLPNLKTRVSLSFFDHPKIRSKEVDYTIRLTDEQGKTVFEKDGTIKRKQTHTFDCGQILADAPHIKWGMLFIDSAEPQLGSLRIYAGWYGPHSMTTTHEKSALATFGPLMIFPTVVSSAKLETYLAITNRDENQTLKLECQLLNHLGKRHPTLLNVTVDASNTTLLPLTPYYKDMEDFLSGKPGALYVSTNNLHAVYYYFIENKELGTWQIQHL